MIENNNKKYCKKIFYIYIIIILLSCTEKKTKLNLTKNSLIIVEITKNDINKLKFQNENTINNDIYLKKIYSSFLLNFSKSTKYIFLDYFFVDDNLDTFNENLIRNLSLYNNTNYPSVMILGGFMEGIIEEIYLLKKNPLHVFFLIEKNGISVEPEMKIRIKYSFHNKLQNIYKHAYIYILDYLNIKHSYNRDEKIFIHKKNLNKFKKISYSEVINNNELIKDKIIILWPNYKKKRKDIHKIGLIKKIEGPQILCNIIYYMANRNILEKK